MLPSVQCVPASITVAAFVQCRASAQSAVLCASPHHSPAAQDFRHGRWKRLIAGKDEALRAAAPSRVTRPSHVAHLSSPVQQGGDAAPRRPPSDPETPRGAIVSALGLTAEAEQGSEPLPGLLSEASQQGAADVAVSSSREQPGSSGSSGLHHRKAAQGSAAAQAAAAGSNAATTGVSGESEGERAAAGDRLQLGARAGHWRWERGGAAREAWWQHIGSAAAGGHLKTPACRLAGPPCQPLAAFMMHAGSQREDPPGGPLWLHMFRLHSLVATRRPSTLLDATRAEW